MSERKTTPDILGEILTIEETELESQASSEPIKTEKRAPTSKPKRTSKSKVTKADISKLPNPSKWEYQGATFENSKGWKLRYVGGNKKKGWRDGPLLQEYIEQMGEQGWELISACSGVSLFGQKDNYQLFFKRPQL